jgi:hypothetical protein
LDRLKSNAKTRRGSSQAAARHDKAAWLLARRVDGIFLSDFEQGEIGLDLFRHACLLGLEGMECAGRNANDFQAPREHLSRRADRSIKVKNRQHPAFSRVGISSRSPPRWALTKLH